METKDINNFKRFLKSNGMNTMFVGLYRQYRYEDNPIDIQEYLQNVPRNCVIQYAFDTSKIVNSSTFGAKYWDEMHEKWLKFIHTKEERHSFELSPLEEKAKRAKEKKDETSASQIVKNDWSGLDLLDVNVKSSRKIQMPDQDEVRIDRKKKNVVVLNNELSNILSEAGLDSMDMRVDRKTNRMVFVFGNGLKFYVGKYSNETRCLQSKDVVLYLSKYLEVEFEQDQHYYVKIAQRMWSKTHQQYAIVLSQKYTIK